ncbi:transmembrane and immunoglobulin domain-containing protein 2 [Alexandromys fortis]|uniref:transmembrane and immunoglobulin domain-containing protein 2 n=1 Tax=Alexandromys fortis TaxID=100897 RepID=UPI0021532C5F|nr:transmembrane and immunoglobulin domain-containing protein 2 [Microtus fortis]
MESPGWAFILLQFCCLQEAVSLSVEQWPHSVRVTQGDEVWLSCGVNQSQAWERLRVEWIRDKVVLCHLLISNGNLSTVDCGARGQLSWQSLTNFSLRLDHLSLNDSGDYVCRATLEIPKLQKAESNGIKVLVEAGDLQLKETSSGLLLMLLVAGGVVAALVVLGAVLWGLSRCRRVDSGNSFYSNVLYRPREIPHRPRARPKKKDAGSEQRAQVIYSTAFPKPAPRQQLPVSKPSPRPGYPISVHCASSASRRK